jgi:hypothetical protein
MPSVYLHNLLETYTVILDIVDRVPNTNGYAMNNELSRTVGTGRTGRTGLSEISNLNILDRFGRMPVVAAGPGTMSA